MSETDTILQVTPTATPTEAEIAAWQALPRDEQLRRLRAELTHPDAQVAGTLTMTDIQAIIAARRAGRADRG